MVVIRNYIIKINKNFNKSIYYIFNTLKLILRELLFIFSVISSTHADKGLGWQSLVGMYTIDRYARFFTCINLSGNINAGPQLKTAPLEPLSGQWNAGPQLKTASLGISVRALLAVRPFHLISMFISIFI